MICQIAKNVSELRRYRNKRNNMTDLPDLPDLPIEIIGIIATCASQKTLINIYACSSGMSFLAPMVEDIQSERSFLLGSIVRATGNILAKKSLWTASMEKLREIYHGDTWLMTMNHMLAKKIL